MLITKLHNDGGEKMRKTVRNDVGVQLRAGNGNRGKSMRTKTGRRTWIASGATWIIALLFLLGIWLLSVVGIPTASAEDLPAPDYNSIPDSDWVKINKGVVAMIVSMKNNGTLQSSSAKPVGDIDEPEEFCYVMFSGVSGTYKLGANFKILADASDWYDYNSTLAANTTLDGNGKIVWNEANKTVKKDGEGNVIRDKDGNVTKDPTLVDTVGGLLSTTAAGSTIKDLYYYFTGAYYTNVLGDHTSLTCGGFIGENNGTIDHCRIECAGSITTEALKKESVSNVGGVIGVNKGEIKNSALISASDVMVYNAASGTTDYTRCNLYAGGVIGVLEAKGFDGCSVLSKARVMCCDYTRISESMMDVLKDFLSDIGDTISGWFGGGGGGEDDEDDLPYNPVRYVHPAGSIVAYARGSSYAKNCHFEVWGSANSFSYEGGSNEGTISGGFIGLMDEGYGGTISNNYFKLGCYVSPVYIQLIDMSSWSSTLAGLLNDLLDDRTVNTYGGTWVGKAYSDGAYKIKNNVIYVEGDNSIIETAAEGNDDSEEHAGLLCGKGLRNNTENTNNWFIRKLAQCDTGCLIDGTYTDKAEFNFVNVFGDGVVVATPNADGSIKMKAAPGKSPFYGWTKNPNADAPTFSTSKERTFSGDSRNEVLYLFFIDTEIKSSGELTQFALDVNLIKAYVWAHLSEVSNNDGKVHFANMKITLKWLTAELKADILVERGTPVIEEFYGKFYGNGHKISFASGSHIMHEFKKDSEDEEKEYYSEYTTGLFGIIKSGAVVQDLSIVYGGAISEENGLTFDVTEAARDQMSKLKKTPKDDTNTVESRTVAYNAFPGIPSSLDVDTSYLYLLTGDGYSASNEWNPGYVEVYACAYNVVVDTHYLGVLAGKNYGTVSGIDLEMTTTGSITAQANNVVCGGLIGYNEGSVTSADVTLSGKIECTSSSSAKVGGVFGVSNNSSDYTDLNVWIAGEVVLARAEKYHRVIKHFYDSGKSFKTEEKAKEACEGEGYEVIAYDFDNKDTYAFGVKDPKATASDVIHGNDPTTVSQTVGVLIGYVEASGNFYNCIASAGAEGVFNTAVIQCSEDGATIGGINGYTASVPQYNNVWAVMSSDAVGRYPVPNHTDDTGINTVYVDGGIAIGTIDDESDPIKFSIEAIEGKTFAGWYDHVSVVAGVLNTDDKQMILTGFETEEVSFGEGDDAETQTVEYFRPANQTESNRVFYVRLINLQIFEAKDLVALSETTRAGRSYEDITFTLAENIQIPERFNPIGTEEHPFLGIFDGNGMTLTLSGVGDPSVVGLFGCIGKEGSTIGTVKNFTINVTRSLGTNNTQLLGVVAAKNYGTIGQDSSNGKIIVKVQDIITGVIVGGIVGENHGVVKNCEVTYISDTKNIGTISANGSSGTAYAGGAIGKNANVTSANVKNVIVTFEDTDGIAQIIVTGDEYVLGGIVGENGAGATLATSVAVMAHDSVLGGVNDVSEDTYGAYLIGNNLSDKVSSLWVLYKTTELGTPVTVNAEEDNDVFLLNGVKQGEGNILIMYGEGSIETTISGVDDQITFYSEKTESGENFYAYLSDFDLGTYVPESEGNTGYAFAPVALTGKVYYAVFADSVISSEEEYSALADRINKDNFRAYVNYTISKAFELKSMDSDPIGKDADHPFRGSLTSNNNAITLVGNKEDGYNVHALLGYVGQDSIVSNVVLCLQSGTRLTEAGTNLARGILCNVNNGTISGVSITVRGLVYNEKGAVGAIAGENNGTITSANVYLEYTDYLGIKTYGSFIGKQVGGAVGINKGIIGSLENSTVEVHVERSDKAGLLYGNEATGGVVGVNETGGRILSSTSMISGVLIGDGNVGGTVGTNKGSIVRSFSNVLKGATYFATNFGGIAGSNTGSIGTDQSAFVSDIRVYIEATPCYDDVTYSFTVPKEAEPYLTKEVASPVTAKIGGVAAINQGELHSMSVEIRSPLYASEDVGGIAGINQGEISFAELTTAAAATLVADKVGGIAAENKNDENRVSFLNLTLNGALGSAAAGGKGVVKTSLVGAFFASSVNSAGADPSTESTTGGTKNVVVTLYGAIAGDTKALALARGNIKTDNSWLQATNASPLPLAVGENNSGNAFNSIRVLNDRLLDVFIGTDGRIKFTSKIKSTELDEVAYWYTDIKGWSLNEISGIITGLLTENLIDDNASYVTPRTAPSGKTYYVCYDELSLSSADKIFDLAIKINNHDYYRDVRFALSADIYVEKGESLTPIGTEAHPFNAIFDGNRHIITFYSGSIVSGTEYAGLFGYTAENAVLRDFILDIRLGAKVGGVNTKIIGALVGENHGAIENVHVNLSTELIANSTATVGTFAGRFVTDGAYKAVNCWVASANSTHKAVGEVNANAENLCYGVNALDILGGGAFTVDYTGNGGAVLYTVPSSVDVGLFAGFYSDIEKGTPVTGTEFGDFIEPTGDSKVISVSPSSGKRNAVVTVSFFRTTISTAKEFIDFANNVNLYGDRGASFDLTDDVTIDFDECPSVGTKERPFTGTFNGYGNTIRVTGDLIKRDYAGVFGYVSVGGKVNDLKIEVGEDVVFGDRSTIYAGIAAAYLRGTLKNVAVIVPADTVVYTTQGTAASGGLVGRAAEGYSLVNAWLVLAEGATVTNAVGEEDYYLTNSGTRGVGRIMQQVGEGELRTKVNTASSDIGESIRFSYVSGSFYGFIDNDNNTEDNVSLIHDDGVEDRWTVDVKDVGVGMHMLAIFIQADIGTYEDLKRLSADVRMGRNFRGITYNLTNDIVLQSDFIPIGGEFTSAASGSYTLSTFIGGFNGNGHKITLPSVMNNESSDGLRYAGLFGRVGKEARIYDLLIVAPENAAIGYDTGDNTTRTLYAGVLAGYYDMVSGGVSAKKGYFKNVFIVLEKGATLYGATSVGRTFGYIPREAGTVTENCWVVSYNSKVNYEMNEEEINYWNSPDKSVGTNQGGVHNIMVIAAGKVTVGRANNAFYLVTDNDPHWYPLNSISDEIAEDDLTGFSENNYIPTGEETYGYNVSYLKEEIKTFNDLKKYAENINKGYDFYNLTFKLGADITIDRQETGKDFIAIGTAKNGLNGTFDGCGHTITLTERAKVEGAGIFAYIAEDGILKNLRIVLKGTIESDGYVGAIGYNYGRIENLLVVSDGVTLSSMHKGFVIGYDDTNLLTNVWGLVDASEYLPEVGSTTANKSSVNTLKVIGIGKIEANFNDAENADYRVKFTERAASDAYTPIGISGWYKSYEDRQQISSAMLSGGELSSTYMIAPYDSVAAHYEVDVIKKTIDNQDDLIALAGDVNYGGYSFKNVEFTLGNDVNITTTTYMSIGNEAHAFKGIFNGNGKTITVKTLINGGIFGNNEGEVKDLFVVIQGRVGAPQSDTGRIYGGIANRNGGTITHCKVTVDVAGKLIGYKQEEQGKIIGYTVGGIAGRNDGTIEDCIVYVEGSLLATGGSGNNLYAGGIAGVNYGTIEGTSDFSKWTNESVNVIVNGTVSAVNSGAGQTVDVGGVVGYNDSGKVVRMIAEIFGTVSASAATDESAENIRAGGFVGYARASIDNNVIILHGKVSGGLVGGTAGYLEGVTVRNVWQLTYTDAPEAVGKGARQVNRLCVKGSGLIAVAIAFDSNSILFTNVTAKGGADLDGWYESEMLIGSNSKIGNVDGDTFRPDREITNKYVEVVFVNTLIKTAADLVSMASSVSGGLSGTDIVFELAFEGESLTINEEDGIVAIGTARRSFNNVFDGKNKTLIFNALGGTDYVGLFGYIGSQGVVKNVTLVLNEGTYGSADALYTALLAAYSDGKIENVTLVIDKDAILIGQNVGALAGASFGEVKDVTVTTSGVISAVSNKEAYAAAVIAKNEGKLTNVTVTSEGSITAVGQTYSYAGILAAKTTSTISVAEVSTSSVLSAGAGNAYAGFGVGINLGKLENVYIEVTGGGFSGIGKNGGIVGNNSNELSGVFIKLPAGGLGVGNDGAIGYVAGAGETIRNVWVYAQEISSMSKVPAVNCIAADEGMALTCPKAEEVKAGIILYKGTVSGLTDRFGLFATVTDGVSADGTGAETANVTYETAEEVNYLKYTSTADVKGVKVLFTARNKIGSGSELAAFAAAVNSGKYAFSGTFTLTKDFTLPTGAFIAIGTAEHALSGDVTFNGQDHIVTVDDATIPNGVFGITYATIENVGLRLTASGDGTLIKEDHGTVRNVALYVEKDVTVNAGTVIVADEQGTATNAWVITRNDGTNHAAYPVMKVNGDGTVTMKDTALFAECTDEDAIFIGYADAAKILITDNTFPTGGKTGSYTAEFIPTVITSEEALRVLDGVLKLSYTGEGQTFTLGDNVTVTSTLAGMNAYAFKGTIDGAGYTLAVNNAVEGTLFGKLKGTLRNLRIDLSAAKADLALFATEATPVMDKVVIVEDREDLKLGTTGITASQVWFETTNATLFGRFASAPYSSYSVILNHGKAPIAYTFDEEGIDATEREHETQVFAGWKVGDKIVSCEKAIRLPAEVGSAYELNFINRTLTSGGDLVKLAEAVQGGFTYQGVTFTVENGFEVDSAVPTIGSVGHRFEGNIRGTKTKSKITFTEDTSVFLYALYGRIENLTFVFKGAVTGAEGPTLVCHNYGTMSAVVVLSGDAFDNGAALTYHNEGTLINSWFVTFFENGDAKDVKAVADGSSLGTNRIVVDEDAFDNLDVQIAATSEGVRIRFGFVPDTGSYLALYDEEGKVAFFDNYVYADHSYVAPAKTTGIYLEARSLTTVSNEDELRYLRQFLANRHLASGSIVTLKNDLTVTSAISMPLGYKVNEEEYTFTFDLGYHTLTVSSTAKGTLFTSENDMFGTIQNGTVSLTEKNYQLASEGIHLNNVALHLPVTGITLPTYDVTNCAIVTPHKEYYKEAYACYYYQDGASVIITVSADDIAVTGADNDSYYYAATLDYLTLNALTEKTLYGLTRNYEENETEIIYAPAVIASADDFKRFVLANEQSLTKFEGKNFTFSADVEVASITRTLAGFKGTLDAGHTLTVTSGNYTAAVVSAAEGGSFRNFALAFGKDCTLSATDMISGETENCVVVSYNDLTPEKLHAESTVITLNAHKNGSVGVSFENGISFTGYDKGVYALYSWKTSNTGDPVNKAENGFAKKTLSLSDFPEDKSFIATFDRRYSFTLEFVDKEGDPIDGDVLAENAGYLPTFKLSGADNVGEIYFENGQAICFENDFSSVMKIEVTDIGTGFMFWGLTSDVAKDSAWVYSLSAPSSVDLKATVKVHLTYVKMAWSKMTYSAGTQTITKTDVITAIEAAALASGKSPEYTYESLGDTPPCVGEKPYHAGKYRVNFVVKEDGKVLCNAYAGLEITPVELSFVSVKIEDKTYDGSDEATLSESVQLGGFLTAADREAVSVDGLKFRFADANAGSNKQIKISGEGSLRCSDAKANDNTYRYTYLDYTFDFDAPIKSSEGGLITATIRKKDLKLEIDSTTVYYLEQFNVEAKPFLPANTTTLDGAVAAGLIEKDYALYTEVVSGLLTRENADSYAVGAYRIIVNKASAFDKLSNYNVSVSGQSDSDPYYIVKPSEIEITLEGVTAEYGSRYAIGGYVVRYKGAEVDISALKVLDETGEVTIKTVSDKLVFENAVFGGGAELIPSDTKYGVRCLFSAKNANYVLKETEGAEYEALNGESLRVIEQAEILKIDKKTIKIISDDKSNTKSFGKKAESLYASLVNGYRFVENTHKLVITREKGETVGKYGLFYSVIDTANSDADVTDRYDLQKEETANSHHQYTIAKVSLKIRIKSTSLKYGESVGDKLKYSVVIGDGSLTVRDLYYALHGKEKKDAVLADIGVSVSFTGQDRVLNVGKYGVVRVAEDAHLDADAKYVGIIIDIGEQAANIEEEVGIIGGDGCIEVTKRYLSVVLTAGKDKTFTQYYNGTGNLQKQPSSEVGDQKKDDKGNVISVSNGLIEKDDALVDVVMTRAYVVGHDGSKALNVGTYNVDAEFAICEKGTKRVSEIAGNYEIHVKQISLEVKQAEVRVDATIGYFNEDGSFTTASVTHKTAGGSKTVKSGEIFYGDTRAVLCFKVTVGNSYSFLSVPKGTEKEVSDYLEKELKLSYYTLCRVAAGTYTYAEKNSGSDAEKEAKRNVLGLTGLNNNYNVQFRNVTANIAAVRIKVTLLPTIKTIGNNDPTINYVLTALDDQGGQVIEDYFDYAGDVYNVTILADRTEGESLGKYEYSNIVVEVSNSYSGEVLTEKIQTDETQAVLVIKQQAFLKTTVGKILVYGGSLFVVLAGAVFFVLYVTVLRQKWKNKKKKKDEELFSDEEEKGSDADEEATDEDTKPEEGDSPEKEVADDSATGAEEKGADDSSLEVSDDAEKE